MCTTVQGPDRLTGPAQSFKDERPIAQAMAAVEADGIVRSPVYAPGKGDSTSRSSQLVSLISLVVGLRRHDWVEISLERARGRDTTPRLFDAGQPQEWHRS